MPFGFPPESMFTFTGIPRYMARFELECLACRFTLHFRAMFRVVSSQLSSHIWVRFDGAVANMDRTREETKMHELRTIAVVLMIGTLAVFLFPLSAGPFTSTNGPVTAFRAAAAALALLFSITTSVCLSLQLRAGYVRRGGDHSVLRQKRSSCSCLLSDAKTSPSSGSRCVSFS